jgi:hypothetical protein
VVSRNYRLPLHLAVYVRQLDNIHYFLLYLHRYSNGLLRYISMVKNQILPSTCITNVDSIYFHNIVSCYHQQLCVCQIIIEISSYWFILIVLKVMCYRYLMSLTTDEAIFYSRPTQKPIITKVDLALYRRYNSSRNRANSKPQRQTAYRNGKLHATAVDRICFKYVVFSRMLLNSTSVTILNKQGGIRRVSSNLFIPSTLSSHCCLRLVRPDLKVLPKLMLNSTHVIYEG